MDLDLGAGLRFIVGVKSQPSFHKNVKCPNTPYLFSCCLPPTPVGLKLTNISGPLPYDFSQPLETTRVVPLWFLSKGSAEVSQCVQHIISGAGLELSPQTLNLEGAQPSALPGPCPGLNECQNFSSPTEYLSSFTFWLLILVLVFLAGIHCCKNLPIWRPENTSAPL